MAATSGVTSAPGVGEVAGKRCGLSGTQYLLAKDSTLVLFLTRCRGVAVLPTSVLGSVVTCRGQARPSRTPEPGEAQSSVPGMPCGLPVAPTSACPARGPSLVLLTMTCHTATSPHGRHRSRGSRVPLPRRTALSGCPSYLPHDLPAVEHHFVPLPEPVLGHGLHVAWEGVWAA